jgi:hypothetical protein
MKEVQAQTYVVTLYACACEVGRSRSVEVEVIEVKHYLSQDLSPSTVLESHGLLARHNHVVAENGNQEVGTT